MAVDYVRLWKLLLDKGMKKTDLKTEAGISSNVLAKLGKNEYVSIRRQSIGSETYFCEVP